MEWKNLIIIFLILLISCSSRRLEKEKENLILSKDYGLVVIDFDDRYLFSEDERIEILNNIKENKNNKYWWNCSFEVNGDQFFRGGFGIKETYKIPIPVGVKNVSYSLFLNTSQFRMLDFNYDFSSGESRFFMKDNINLDIKKNKVIFLKIVKLEKARWATGCISSVPMVWIKKYNRIGFEIDKEEELNP